MTIILAVLVINISGAHAGGCLQGGDLCGKDGTVVEHMTDNFNECGPHVKRRITEFRKRYPRFHFSCRNGVLLKLGAPLDADLFKKSPHEFALEHWDLYLASAPKDSLEFRPSKYNDSHQFSAQQYYKGHEIWNGLAFVRRPVRIDGIPGVRETDYAMLHVEMADTSRWKFDPKVLVSPQEAMKLARAFDREFGAEGDHYSVDNWPVIVTRHCGGGPALVHRVSSFTYSDKKSGRRVKDLHILPVNTATGKVCRWR